MHATALLFGNVAEPQRDPRPTWHTANCQHQCQAFLMIFLDPSLILLLVNSRVPQPMSANFQPLLGDLINLVDSFPRIFEILRSEHAPLQPNSDQLPSISGVQLPSQETLELEEFIFRTADHVRHSAVEAEGKENPQETDVSSEPSPVRIVNSPLPLAPTSLSKHLLALNGAISNPIQAINAIISIHIISSFDGVLQNVLTPTQCAQLVEAISLANLVSELDKQLHTLKTTANYHGQEDDAGVKYVQDVRTDLLQASESIQVFILQHTEEKEEQKPVSLALSIRYSRMALLISDMYADLEGDAEATEKSLVDQERCIVALKCFLEDKIEAFNTRHYHTFHMREEATVHNENDWPPATIPAAQLATKFMSGMLAHFRRRLEPGNGIQSAFPSLGGKAEVIQLVPEPIDLGKILEDNSHLLGAQSFEESNPSAPVKMLWPPGLAAETGPRIDSSISMLRTDERRDSAVLFMSPVEDLKCDIDDKELRKPDDQGEVDSGIGASVHLVTSEDEAAEIFEEEADSSSAQSQVHEGFAEPNEVSARVVEERILQEIREDLVDNLSHVEDASISKASPPLLKCAESLPESISAPTPVHMAELHTTSIMNFAWPQRTWLQHIVSLLAPDPERKQLSCSPILSTSRPEDSCSLGDSSSLDLHPAYVTWWETSGEVSDESLHSESIADSISEQSWGAGSRSTDADSIDL